MSDKLRATDLQYGDLVRYRATDTTEARTHAQNDRDVPSFRLGTVMQAPPFTKQVADAAVTFEEAIELRSRGPLKQTFIIHVSKLESQVHQDGRADRIDAQ